MKINDIVLLINVIIILIVSLYNFEILSYYRLYRYDDIIHFFIYFLLSIIALYNTRNNLPERVFIYTFIFLLPVITEFLQKFTNRTPDIADLYYDYIGLTAGLFIIIIYKYVKRN